MTTPIKPMSAEDFIKFAFGTRDSSGLDRHNWSVRRSLASYLAYVKEKIASPRIASPYADGVDDCRTVIQSEIDELTK